MQKMFRINRKVPTTKDEMFKLYISLLKHITTNDILMKIKGTTQKSRKTTYKLNKDMLCGLGCHRNKRAESSE